MLTHWIRDDYVGNSLIQKKSEFPVLVVLDIQDCAGGVWRMQTAILTASVPTTAVLTESESTAGQVGSWLLVRVNCNGSDVLELL